MKPAALLLIFSLLKGVLPFNFGAWGNDRNFFQDYERELIEYPFAPRNYDHDFSQYIHVPTNKTEHVIEKREVIEPIFKGNPKTQEERWHENFDMDALTLNLSASLVALLLKIINKYMIACIPVILYDRHVQDSGVLKSFFEQLPITYIQAKVNENYTLDNPLVLNPRDIQCRSYILFLSDIMKGRNVLGPQIDNRIVIVARSTQWKVQEYLSAPESRDLINLLVIGKSYSLDKTVEPPYILYTHKLYVDGLGTNRPRLLTSWMKGKLSRPHVNLFPEKLKGFAGHRLTIAATDQPPFIFKQLSTDPFGNVQVNWDGVELRVLQILARNMNFSIVITEPRTSHLGKGDAVTDMLVHEHADLGVGGLYVTKERIETMELSVPHSLDCAGFLTLSSTSLPRSRAILGPFQWPVWVCLTFTYLVAIFPLAYSDRLSLSHLWGNAGEVENMFWYVFGTFTNSLTFAGEYSWSGTKKDSTRLLIGIYWVFTIIITACYTGSIIAFVTLPVAPDTIDTLDQLKDGFFRIGTFDRGGWERWLQNSSHEKTEFLLRRLEYVSTVEEGVNNVTQAWFFPYAFIASKQELQYIIDTNYTENKLGRRSALHVSDGCLALFGVAFGYQQHSVYKNRFNEVILRMQESGIIGKLLSDVNYDAKRIATGRQQPIGIAASKVKLGSPDERGLTLADTEGMFILLAIGFLIALCVLISEWVGGCTNKVMSIMKRRKDDQNEAERVERDRVEHEENPERRESLFSQTSKLSVARSTPRSSRSIASLSKETLKELYDGPNESSATLCLYNDKLMTDKEVFQAQREILEQIESPPSTAGSNRIVETTAEINREDTTQKNPLETGVFGGEVLY